jgi:D-psicose/D-tagatose/L-ribulose 3-epimerase
MRIGINLLLWTGHVTAAQRPVLEMLRQIGYDLVEVPVMTGSPAHYAELGRWLDEVGLARSSSMAFTDQRFDPISPERAKRRAALERMKWQIDCARALGATKVVGPMFQVLGQFSGTGPTGDERRRAADLLAEVAPLAQQAGVTLAIEPLNRFECHLCNTLQAAVELARQVDHPAIGVMVDTFHANIEEKSTPAAIRAAGRHLVHVHISESDRSTPGSGHIDFTSIMRALGDIGYDGDLVVEAFGRAVPELAAATRVWRDTFDSEEQLARDALRVLRN